MAGYFARATAVAATLALALTAAGCTGSPMPATTPAGTPAVPSPSASEEPAGRGDPIPDEPDLSPPTTETVTLTDPVAQSFTVAVPAGWDTTAYSTGMYSDHRETVVSVSPDGNTVLFVGDPSAPDYWVPSHPDNQTDFVKGWVDQSQLAQWSEYLHATAWGEDWVLGRFGALDGFLLGGTVDDPAEAQSAMDSFARAGISVEATAARTSFTYDTAAGTMTGLVMSLTYTSGQTWGTAVQGLSTRGAVEDYEPMLTAMASSKKLTPDWASRQEAFWQNERAASAAFTQQLIDNHNANMAWIQGSAAAHQQKMQGIWAANDASMASYYDRMASMDGNQRSFLNYINGEHTVRNSAGQTFQVAQGVDVYYVNPATGHQVGGDVNFSEQTLVEMGLDPSDWTRTEIVR